MPFNGSNTFTVVNTFVPGTTILSSAVNANFSDIATGLSDCVTRDAQGAVTGNLLFSSTGYLQLPNGTTAQRPVSAQQAYFRFNSTTAAPEYFDGTAWDSLSPTVATPQGYLTLTNLAGGGPYLTSDVTAATSVYYSPVFGQLCPIYNGTSFVNQIFTEQTLTLVSNHLASTIYDVFAFLNSGAFTIGTGPAWATSTAGSGARGTGAGTTQLQRINGLLTNQQSITLRNGANTYTVSANQGTFLGSIYIDATAGQASCYVTWGTARKWAISNAWNRNPIILTEGDSAANWTYDTNAWRQANGNANNYIDVFSCLPEEPYDLEYVSFVGQNSLTSAQSNTPSIGLGFNNASPTNASGVTSHYLINFAATGGGSYFTSMIAKYYAPRSLGVNRVYPLENGGGSAAATFSGTSAFMQLAAKWRG